MSLRCPGYGDAVPDEIDIYRSANLLIKQHGDKAAIFAAQQADACLEKGDLDGKVVWPSLRPSRYAILPLAGWPNALVP